MEHKLTPPASASCQAQGVSSESGIDRFSDLPDEVAHHISFLNFKDLNRVGALSKRCRQFHLSVPSVDFHTDHWTDKEQIKQHVASLMSSFDRYLHFRGYNRMQRVWILLSFSNCNNETKYCGDQSRLLLKWIHNAVRCNVEDLDLYFSHCVTSSFSLPSFIFHSQSLRSLSVSMDIFESQEFPSGMFPGRRAHSSPEGWRRLRAAVGLLLHYRALSGKSRRARLFEQGSSGKARRARLKEKDSVKFERCLCGALGVGLEAHNQG
ncbi:hypothetical protein ACFX13_033590 [Malus domestica]